MEQELLESLSEQIAEAIMNTESENISSLENLTEIIYNELRKVDF